MTEENHHQDQQLEERWRKVQVRIFRQFNKNPDMNAILFLIGIQEVGQLKEEFTKEEKQDLMHVAICHLLSKDGYYEFTGYDQDGWPHYQQTEAMPRLNLDEQEHLLKKHIIAYFEEV
jgi:hypothetical protein